MYRGRPNGNGTVSIHLDSFLALARSQLHKHGPSQSIIGIDEIGDRNENAASEPVTLEPESADFRLAEDTTTWSSLAIARENIQSGNSQPVNNVNNNLTKPRIQRDSSVESFLDYEGKRIVLFRNVHQVAQSIVLEYYRRLSHHYIPLYRLYFILIIL